eukprot:TRINITY_DN8125_c0_g2_i2.p2 TRINITY_DN8125_c0_g2~~TRINITY_DN8125_c0_g2_i2.p2  ORF type:complete len:159 (+),score=19.76 TRINITY_DN8125_c0_g2_i2:107-583(+)
MKLSWILTSCLLLTISSRMIDKSKAVEEANESSSKETEEPEAPEVVVQAEDAEPDAAAEEPEQDDGKAEASVAKSTESAEDTETKADEDETTEKEPAHEIVPVSESDKLGGSSFRGGEVVKRGVQRAFKGRTLRRVRCGGDNIPVQCGQQHHAQVANC